MYQDNIDTPDETEHLPNLCKHFAMRFDHDYKTAKTICVIVNHSVIKFT